MQDENRAAQSLPTPARLKVGDSLDGLGVMACVADNGINVVYQVQDPRTKTRYALKALHPARAHDPDERTMLAPVSYTHLDVYKRQTVRSALA